MHLLGTRHHVKTALALYADFRKLEGATAKKAWMEEQVEIWAAKVEVCSYYAIKMFWGYVPKITLMDPCVACEFL